MQTDELQKLRARLYDQTPILGRKIRSDAVKALQQDASPEAIAALVEVLIRSNDSKLHTAAVKALLALAAQEQIDAQEALCRLVIEHDHLLARQITLAAQYIPQNQEDRVLFYFLTEQWDAYETLDPNQDILKSLYRSSPDGIQRRIVSGIRRSNRLDWVTVIPGERSRQRASELTDPDWETALSIIVRQGAWDTLWQLVFAAPAALSVRFVLWLRDVQWQSEHIEIQEVLPALIRLAEQCHAQDETPFPYGLTSFQKSLKRGNAGGITCLAISSDSTILAGGTEEGIITVWHLPENKILHSLENHHGYLMNLAMSTDNTVLFSSSEDGSIIRWDLSDGAFINTTNISPGAIEYAAFCADGKMFATGRGGRIGVWNLQGRDPEQLFEIQRDAEISSLVFSPVENLLAEGWDDGVVNIRHLPEGRLVHSLKGHDTPIISLTFSPDGQLLASGSETRSLADIFYDDPCIHLWLVSDGHSLKRLKHHVGTIEALAFSPDGKILASGGGLEDNTAKLWRLPEGTLLQTLNEFLCPVTSFAFSQDGQKLATGSVEGTVRLWDSTLTDLRRVRIGQTTPQTLELLQERLQEGYMTNIERTWLKYILALAGWFIERKDMLPDRAHVGESDIELYT